VVNPTGPYGNSTDDKPFLHKRNGVYYLSWGCFYGTASGPYGPFTYVGSVVDTAQIEPSFRMNQTSGPWYEWEDYQDRHGSFWTAGGQWFFATNDRSHSLDTAHPGVYRDVVLAYVNYFANGTIMPVVIDETGVGEYDAARRIEAEHFMSIAGAFKGHDKDGAFAIHGLADGSMLLYPNVRALPAGTTVTLTLRYANDGPLSPRLVARVKDADGAVLCSSRLPPTDGWAQAACVLDAAALAAHGRRGAGGLDVDVAMTVEGAGEVRLDSFAFEW
jgi:hypothetical protein